MDYRIEKMGPMTVVCKRKLVRKPQGDTATADISAFWRECTEAGVFEKLCRYGSPERMGGILGICFSGEMANSAFPYAIGAEHNGEPLAADCGLGLVTVPENIYAVFECRGRMPDAFRETYKRICSEFFPQSNYEYGNGVELEVYPSTDVSDPNYYCQIWIAVKPKR